MHNAVYAIVKVYRPSGKEEIMKLCVSELHAHDIKASLPFSWDHWYRIDKMEIE